MGGRLARLPTPRGSAALRLYSFADSAIFAARLARRCGGAHLRLREHHFPDGESLIGAPVAGRGTIGPAVLVRSLDQPNRKLVEILLAADALRRSGAGSVTLVAPYLGYMRQDAVFAAGEPLSQRVVGALLADGFDGVLTVEAHLHRIARLSEVAGASSRSLSASAAIRGWLSQRARGSLLVGPDVESMPWIRAIAGDDLPFVVGRKRRRGDRRVSVDLPAFAESRHAVIVDDIASSGATLAATARALQRRGVRRIDAAVVHAIFSPGAEARIRRAGVRRVVSSDTVPHRTNAFSVVPVMASALVERAASPAGRESS